MAVHGKPDYPYWVRFCAVLYVLSGLVSPWLFVIFGAVAGVRWTMVRQFDGWVLALLLCAVGCPALSVAFRRWFRNYGRRRWPEAETDSSSSISKG